VKQTGTLAPVLEIKCIRVARGLVEINILLLLLLLLLCLPDIAVSFIVISKCTKKMARCYKRNAEIMGIGLHLAVGATQKEC
jgi:hypothetical protein